MEINLPPRPQPNQAPTPSSKPASDAPACDVCRDTGYRGWKTPTANYPLKECQLCDCRIGVAVAAYWQRKEAEQQQQRLNKMFVGAGIPTRFRDLTIETLIERAGADPEKRVAIEAVKQFVEEGVVTCPINGRYKAGLLISGKFGCGKTGLITPALRAMIERGKSGLWIEMYDFLGAIQQGYEDGDSSAKLIAAQKADIILIDDLGDVERVKPETDDRRKLIYELINYRHNYDLPMLITTNCDADKIAQQLGSRTMDRIFESCAWVEMGGRNLRME